MHDTKQTIKLQQIIKLNNWNYTRHAENIPSRLYKPHSTIVTINVKVGGYENITDFDQRDRAQLAEV